MKLEGITYFIGLTFGLWMIKSFHNFALFPSVIGYVFAFLGIFGYTLMLWKKIDDKRRNR